MVPTPTLDIEATWGFTPYRHRWVFGDGVQASVNRARVPLAASVTTASAKEAPHGLAPAAPPASGVTAPCRGHRLSRHPPDQTDVQRLAAPCRHPDAFQAADRPFSAGVCADPQFCRSRDGGSPTKTRRRPLLVVEQRPVCLTRPLSAPLQRGGETSMFLGNHGGDHSMSPGVSFQLRLGTAILINL